MSDNGHGATVPALHPLRLNLNTLGNARRSFERLTRRYLLGQVDRGVYTALVAGMNCLLGFHKLELEADMAARLEAVEKQLQSLEHGRRK